MDRTFGQAMLLFEGEASENVMIYLVNFVHSTRVFSPNGIHIKKRDFLHFFTPLLFPTKLISSLDLRESIHMCNYCLLTNQPVDSLAFVLRTDLPKLSFSHAVNEFLIKRVIVEIH